MTGDSTTDIHNRPLTGAAAVYVAGAALILVGLFICWQFHKRVGVGGDFAPEYILAKALVLGVDPYTPDNHHAIVNQYIHELPAWGVFYPPANGVVSLPFTLFLYETAKGIWFLLMIALLLWGLWQTMEAFAPGLPRHYRVLIIGAIFCSSGIRWGFQYLQPAPLATGLLGWFVALLVRKRNLGAFVIGAIVICLKLTFAVPFLGLALLRRQFKMAAALLGIWIAFNALGFARMGGMSAVQSYRKDIAKLEAPEHLNFPDFQLPSSMPRTDWQYLIYPIMEDLDWSHRINLVLSAIAIVWLIVQAVRCGKRCTEPEATAAFLGPLVCLSLLVVYHHHYDASLLFIPLIVYLFGPDRIKRLPGIMWFAVPLIFYIGIYPVHVVDNTLGRLAGPAAAQAMKLTPAVVTLIAMIASCIALRRYVSDGAAHQASEQAPAP